MSGLGSRTTAPWGSDERSNERWAIDRIAELEARCVAAEEALRLLTEGFALQITERIERTHNEFQRLGLVEGRDNRDSEEGRKCLSSMATDAVYFASLVRDARAALAAVPEENRQRVTHGRHCTCTPCAAQDWSEPQLAPCGMHGPDCPPKYQPLGGAGEWAAVLEENQE